MKQWEKRKEQFQAQTQATTGRNEDITVNSSADNAQGIDTADSSGVSVAGNGAIHVSSARANTSVYDAYNPIYSEYTQNLAGGYTTIPPLNTS